MKFELSLIALLLIAAFLVQPAVLSARPLTPGDPNYKDPMIAFLLSFLIPGIGQMWVGDMTRGLIFLIIWVGIWVFASVIFWSTLGWSFVFAPLIALVFAIFAGWDAMNLAKKYNLRGGTLALFENITPNTQPSIIVSH